MTFFGGEFQRKLAELAGFGAHGDLALAILDNAMADGEAKSHALADILGGEERVKDLVQVLPVYAGSVIAENQEGLAPLQAALNPDGRFFAGGEGFHFQRVE